MYIFCYGTLKPEIGKYMYPELFTRKDLKYTPAHLNRASLLFDNQDGYPVIYLHEYHTYPIETKVDKVQGYLLHVSDPEILRIVDYIEEFPEVYTRILYTVCGQPAYVYTYTDSMLESRDRYISPLNTDDYKNSYT